MAEIKTLGPVGLKPTGEYDGTKTYEKLDVVVYQGSSYVAKTESIGQLPTNQQYWQKLVSGGVGVDDIVDNLESSESDKPLSAKQGKILNEKINNYINVKNYGVKGDGITDDTEAIQHVIDRFPNRTIYFPDSTYLISRTIETSATDSEKVYLKFSEKAILKASSTFNGDYLIDLCCNGNITGYADTKNKTGIDGGIFNTNNVTGGIKVARSHLATLTNIMIINLGDFIGIYTDESNNSSSDIVMKNIDIHGLMPSNINSVGIYINSADNYLFNIRTSGTYIGIQLAKGGNNVNHAHPLYNLDQSFEVYNGSVAFLVNGSNCYLNNCYSDNYSTGIKFTGSGSDFLYVNDFFQLWFSAENQNHTFLEITTASKFQGYIKGVAVKMPTTGLNSFIIGDNLTSSTGFIDNVNFQNHPERLNNPNEKGLNPKIFTQSQNIDSDKITLEAEESITQNSSYTNGRTATLQLAISGVTGTQGTAQTIATLPNGVKPLQTAQVLAFMAGSNNSIIPLTAWINTGGNIRLTPSENISNKLIYVIGSFQI